MKIIGIIPARYASTRYPGKPLIEINGKSMLQRVYEQAKLASKLTEVIIATDDQRIVAHAQSFGATVILTKEDHPSGTDRCFEALINYGKSFGSTKLVKKYCESSSQI
jgi:3-deoxy-manno-octulosonate cytidylyltransferase (CMP-KDO synthetase)